MSKHTYTFCSKLLLCLLFVSFTSISQVNYPTDSSFINTLTNADKNNLQQFLYSKIDTSITNFQNYFPRNTNGHLGLPSAPLYINYQAKAMGFNIFTAPYQNDMINVDDVKYYQTKGPYASLTGIAGSKQEQAFKLLFSNTFKNKLNITLGFNRYSGIGFYQKQQSFTNNFYTSSNYTSSNARVGYYAYVLYNKVKHQENGGISNDTLFLENVSINKLLLPVNLKSSKRELRTTTFEFNPWFRLNKNEDSSTVLSHFVNYQFNYSGNFTKYADDAIATEHYYTSIYHNKAVTNDSTHWRNISNGFNYILKINPINAKLQIGAKNEYIQLSQSIMDTVHIYNTPSSTPYFPRKKISDSIFVNNSVSAGFFLYRKKYNAVIKANYIISGSNQGDYLFEIRNQYTSRMLNGLFKSPLVVNLNASIEQRHPDYIYNLWHGNNYNWNNSFLPSEKVQSSLSIGTQDNRFNMGVVFNSIKNILYFNDFALPQQTSFAIQNISLFAQKDILLFNHIGIGAKYNYQSSTYQAIVSVPNHVINGALYYQGNLFKRALQIQIGFNAQYFSSFYGYAYMPATNQYYVQTTKTVGDYPYVDFFLNARIKPVRIFVKIDHVTQGLMGGNYSLTPGYLQNDRAFKFGVNWLFFD